MNVFPTQIEELLLKIPELAPIYLIEVSKDGNLDSVSVSVELDQSAAGVSIDRREEVVKQLQHLVKTYVGITIKINLQAPGEMERSVGKAKRVIDRR